MKITPFQLLLIFEFLFLCGCQGIDCTPLQQAMASNHSATIALLNKTNEEEAPMIKSAAMDDPNPPATFPATRLALIQPADIASWDKTFSGLDSYCAALVTITSGKASADFTGAMQGFNTNLTNCAGKVHFSAGPLGEEVAGALTALGSAVLAWESNKDAQKVAAQADPYFQKIMADIEDALKGILNTYDSQYSRVAAIQEGRFPNDSIPNFASLSASDRGKAIDDLSAWLKQEQDNDQFVSAFQALITSLNKAAQAHAALATGPKSSAEAQLIALKAQIQNAVSIYQNFNK